MKLPVFTIFIIIFSSSFVYDGGFDCKKASLQIEKKICSDKQLYDLDTMMWLAYKKALANPLIRDNLKSEQQIWLTNIRNECQNYECINQVYRKRISTLNNLSIDSEKTKLSVDETTKPIENNIVKYIANNETSIQNLFDKFQAYIYSLIAMFSAWFWNKFIRKRCRTCKSTNYLLLNTTELDRWRQTERVQERLSNGKTKERHVSFTYIKVQRDYKCNDCGHCWNEVSREKK